MNHIHKHWHGHIHIDNNLKNDIIQCNQMCQHSICIGAWEDQTSKITKLRSINIKQQTYNEKHVGCVSI